MSNLPACAVQRKIDPAVWNTLKMSFYPKASDESIAAVIDYCVAAGLDPMQKPVHIVPMWDKDLGQYREVVMPGITLYRIQASRTGKCAGVSEPEFGPDVTEKIGNDEVTYPAWCKVTVRKSLATGVIGDFTAVERWKENYAQKKNSDKTPNSMWSKRPYAQLAKCAEAQAFRKAFPELAVGHTAEEMEGKVLDSGHTVDMLPQETVDTIRAALTDAGISMDAFLVACKTTAIETLEADRVDGAMQWIAHRKAKMQAMAMAETPAAETNETTETGDAA